MKTFLQKLYLLCFIAIVPVVSSAQSGIAVNGSGGRFGVLLGDVLEIINGIIIPFILGIGFLVFVWGMFKFFIYGGADDDAKTSGKSLMVYATLGFVLIIVFWGVVNLVASSTGLDRGTGTSPVGIIPNNVDFGRTP